MYRKLLVHSLVWLYFIFGFKTYGQFKSGTVAIGGGGFVTGIITHPTTGDVYCRTDVGGAYKWDAASNKWVQLLDWASSAQGGFSGVESLAIDPTNPSTIYMLCGIAYMSSGETSILKSTDKGKTFTVTDVTSKFKAHGNGYGRGNGERLAVDPNNSNILFCGTRRNGLWKSSDGGSTWTLAWNGVTTTPNDNGICFVVFDPASASGGVTKTIYIGVSRVGSANIYKSTDGGVTFTDVSPNTAYMPHRAALQGTTMYVTLADNEGPATEGKGGVYKLNTSTGVWTNVTPFGNNLSYGGVAIDHSDINRVVLSTTGKYWVNQYGTTWGDYIYLSTDGGLNWTEIIGKTSKFDNNGIGVAHGQINWAESISFDPLDNKKVRVVGGGGIFTCTDVEAAQTTWFYDVKGIEETAWMDGISIPGGPLMSAMGDMDGFVHYDINTYPTQFHQPSVGTNRSIAYAGKNPNKLVRSSDGGAHVYYSNDQGVSWTACPTTMATGYGGLASINADGSTILNCPDKSSVTYYTHNNGASWAASSGVNITDAIAVGDPVNSNYFYIFDASNGKMLVSSNKGVSFSAAGTPGASSTPWTATVIRTVPGYEGHLWVPLVDNGLRYSTDHGATYTTVAKVTYCKAIGIGKAITPKSYPTIFVWGTVGGVRGLFRSVDKGVNWTRINDDDHEFGGAGLVLGDVNVFGRVYLGTGIARGIVYWDDLTKYTVTTTASPSPGGVVNGAGTYSIGTTVELTAVPAPGYIFTGWSGDASGTATSVTVDMDGDKTVTATFQEIKYTLTATASPSAGGTVTGAGSYTSGSTATLTATPAAGYTFVGWSGDATGSTSSINVTMDGNKTVTATFQEIKYTLTAIASPSTGGTITGAGSYTSGSTATLTATPAAGYTFTGWSGDATGSTSSINVTMDGNKTVTATFQEIKYTLTATASPSAGGTVTGAGSYTSGSTATLTATPAAGYTFTGWSGDVTGSASSTTVTMDGNKTVTANFQEIKYILTTTASPSAGGTVTGAGSYTSGSTATLTATPAAGYTFTGWSGDATGTSSSVTVTMDGNKSVTATFEVIQPDKYTLTTTTSPVAGGTVTGAGSYTSGSTAILTATPAAGYTFTGWSGDATGSTSSINVTMDGNKSVTATFQEIKYTLTATASPAAGGTITGAGSYTSGSTATLTATPAAGYTFTGWSGDATGSTSSINVTMDGNKSVTATFQEIKYTLTVNSTPSAGGTVTGAGSYTSGSVVTLTATPVAGYTFIGWTGDVTGTDASVTLTMDGDKNVTANFQQQSNTTKYTVAITISPSNGGSVIGAGAYDAGSVVTLTATPAAGYIFTGWSGDIIGTDATQTVTVNSDMVVQANFQGIDAVALKIPKLFSPDSHGDMSTEAWNIENAYLLDGCEIVIYNRQGQQVYSSTGYSTPWDGTSNGKPLPDGAYFYIIRHPDNSKLTGSVTIARLK